MEEPTANAATDPKKAAGDSASGAADVGSLKAGKDAVKARNTMLIYELIAIPCAFLILIYSLFAFVASHFADKITTDIDTANALALKLQAELGPCTTNQSPAIDLAGTPNVSADLVWWGTSQPPPGLADKDVINDLRQFAGAMREIDGYTRQLNHFVFNFATDHYASNRTDQATMKR
jgi:hypothetical protein